jgi:hypothetical protein
MKWDRGRGLSSIVITRERVTNNRRRRKRKKKEEKKEGSCEKREAREREREIPSFLSFSSSYVF